jgi:hypothetical protein
MPGGSRCGQITKPRWANRANQGHQHVGVSAAAVHRSRRSRK